MEDQLLEQMETSEYGIAGVLAGISDEELLATVRRNPKAFRTRLMKVSAGAGQKSSTVVASGNVKAASRAEFEDRFGLLNKELQQGLRSKTHQLADASIYVVKSISAAKTIKMLEDSDTKIVGVSNISSGKLEKNEVFLLSGIRLLYGVGSSTANTQTGVNTVSQWIPIPIKIQNGEFTLRAAGKTLIDRMANSVFATHNVETVSSAAPAIVGGVSYGDGPFGYYKLANPKLIETQQAIELNLEWADSAAANSYLKVEFIGTKVMKY